MEVTFKYADRGLPDFGSICADTPFAAAAAAIALRVGMASVGDLVQH